MNLFRTPVLAVFAFVTLAGCSDGKIDMSKVPLRGLGMKDKDASMVETGVEAGVTGLSAVTLTEADEDEMGRTVAIAATNRWPLFDRPALTKYVTLVGLTIANASSNPGGNWVFGVLDTPEIGAYSGPNGYILITRGAIAAMEDEAELAGILAHEVAHVVNRDGFNAVSKGRLTGAFLQAAQKLASTDQQHLELFKQQAGPLVEKSLTSGWSQGQETAADRDAVGLLTKSGYDPAGLPRFLARVQQRQGDTGGKLFGTHPGTGDRIQKTTAQIGAGKTGATNRERFAKSTAEAKL